MTVGMQQPYLLPYLGYWQMINAVDTFVIGDMSHMIKNGWIHQNRILQRHAGPYPFRLSLVNKSGAYMKPLCEVEILSEGRSEWKRHMRRMLEQNYCKAPYYNETMALIMPLLDSDEPNLSDYLYAQIKAVAGYLDMKTNIVRGKDVLTKEEYDLPVMEKIQLLRDRLGFDTWLSLSNGAHYYTKEMMAEIGIDILFHHIDTDISYQQVGVRRGEPHVPYLSIIDVLMNCGKEGTKVLLDRYTVV